MKNVVKNLSLALVVATAIVQPGSADKSVIGAEFDGNLSQTRHSKSNIDKIFDEPQSKAYPKDENAFFENILSCSVMILRDIEGDQEDVAPSQEVANVSAPENEIFKDEELNAFQKEANLISENLKAQKLAQKIIDESQERQRQASQPSNLELCADYICSACKTVLNHGLQALDWVARTKPAAYLVSYTGVDLIEEGLAYTGYIAAGVLGTWNAGPVAGEKIATGTYSAIKAGFKVLHTVMPGSEGAVAALATGTVQEMINAVLDSAPAVADSVASAASSVASYIKSFWN